MCRVPDVFWRYGAYLFCDILTLPASFWPVLTNLSVWPTYVLTSVNTLHVLFVDTRTCLYCTYLSDQRANVNTLHVLFADTLTPRLCMCLPDQRANVNTLRVLCIDTRHIGVTWRDSRCLRFDHGWREMWHWWANRFAQRSGSRKLQELVLCSVLFCSFLW